MAAVTHPRKAPPGKLHWNWEILLRCNYRCGYCTVHDETAPFLELGVPAWAEVWERVFRLYGCCQVRFSGGEPTLYPGFMDLVRMLLQMHTVDLTTNLSFDAQEWLRKVPAEGVAVSGSLHPESVRPEEFLAKLEAIRDRGNRLVSACMVAYPPHLGMLGSTRELFESRGVLFKIIPFNGVYRGLRYPEAYTEAERRLLGEQVEKSPDPLARTLNRQWQEFGGESPGGALCHMGEMYAKIHCDGLVRRCCHKETETLGLITDPGLRLYDEARPCPAARCACWKAMKAGSYEAKAGELWKSPRHPRWEA